MTDILLRFRPLILATMLGVTGVSLAACNTMEGVGEDVEAAGSSLEEEAEDANN